MPKIYGYARTARETIKSSREELCQHDEEVATGQTDEGEQGTEAQVGPTARLGGRAGQEKEVEPLDARLPLGLFLPSPQRAYPDFPQAMRASAIVAVRFGQPFVLA